MPDDDRGLFAQSRHQTHHVADGLTHVIGFDGIRSVRLAKAALIGNDNSIAGFDQRHDLAPPHVPEVGKAVQQNDQRALALIDVMQADAIEFGKAVIECSGVIGVHLLPCSGSLTETRCCAHIHYLPPSFCRC
ncbi:hypothetical protein D9M71_340270 [compost metagenome]